MVYRSAAHRVREDRVRTLIGLTTLSGLTAQRVGVEEAGRDEKHRLLSSSQAASCPTKGSGFDFLRDQSVFMWAIALGSSNAATVWCQRQDLGLGVVGHSWVDTPAPPTSSVGDLGCVI